jgi:LacI family transcriptional regulator
MRMTRKRASDMRHDQPLRMLAHLDMRHAASREMTGGILRFAATHRRWEVQFAGAHPSNESLEHFADWRPDALIIDSSCHDAPQKELSAISGRATVFVNTNAPRRWRKPYAQLTTDERMLAVEAAALFRRKGLSHFAFVGSPAAERWSEARKRFFRAALKDMGFALNVFSPTPDVMSWQAQGKALAEWLVSLPKPCGVWAAFDQRAKHVLDACRLAGLNVPSQIQVLGVDNETYICEQTVPSLSSLMPDFENGGFLAAEFLDAALHGGAGAAEVGRRTTLRFAFKGAVERLSTADVNGTARRVAAAREFIRLHATSDIDVPHVAASIGVSVRLLQRDYRAVTGRTVLDDIQNEKLERVKDLLRKTTTPIDAIGPFCGFKSPAHLKTLFKKRFGMTMGTYRTSSS